MTGVFLLGFREEMFALRFFQARRLAFCIEWPGTRAFWAISFFFSSGVHDGNRTDD